MTDTYEEFFVEDDDLLASVLEESLRVNTEGRTTAHSIDVNKRIPDNNSNVKKVIVDLCESPKKNSTVQSRLSHFFKKPISDDILKKKANSEQENQIGESCFKIDSLSTVHNNADSIASSSPAIFHKGQDAEGFHLSSGSNYVYPSNYPVREYQMNIIETALFNNTLVSLPTGMGKTFIAAVVMYNFYRWYPMGKIVFMAPTRPLVTQQVEACHSIMGFPRDVTFEMTGNISPEQRYLAWKKYRVFFLTPQVMVNDLNLNKCPSNMIKCVIVDEAHRATKDYAYVQVLKYLHKQNQMFRIVGLSATPGTTIETVVQVIQNLNISKLEFRTDECLDVMKYTNKKDVQCIPVKLTNAILQIRSQFLAIYDNYSRRLKQYGVLPGNITNLSKFQILTAKQKFMTSNLFREMPKSLVGCLINDFTVCISLAYTLELLTIYGIKVFYLQSLELTENHKCLSNDATFQSILHNINKELNLQDLTWSHPKLSALKQIVQSYFSSEDVQSNSKIIIFCQYRLVVVEVFELLKTFGSSVKPVMFVGQSLKEKGGLPQKKQLEVMNRFKRGDFNVLIATSVAEEGLDIGEVDLIICLEANRSPIKFIQRLGRTGRKRSGKCITLLTEGKEQMKYKSSVTSSKTLVLKMLKNNTILSNLAPEGPRLIPKYIKPERLMIHVKLPENCLPKNKKGKCIHQDNNILQYVAPNNEEDEEEERLNVFQNNKDKPKRRSKKQKKDELELNDNPIEAKSSTSWYLNNNSFDNDLNAPESLNIPLAISESNLNDEQYGSFIAEEKVFKEWVESCKQSNSVLLNNNFFELLNLFADSLTAVNEYGGESLKFSTENKRNIQSTENADVSDIDLTTQRIYKNVQPLRNVSNCVMEDNVKDSTDQNIIVNTIGTDLEEFNSRQRVGIGEHNGMTRSNICNCGLKSDTMDCKCYGSKLCVEQTDYKNDALDTIVDLVDDDDECARNIDFGNMFKSQKADCYIEEYMNKISEDTLCNVNIVENDDDDVISISDSPDFFTGRLSKKTTQTKLEDCFDAAVVSTTTEVEVTNLCSPSPPNFVTVKSMKNDKSSTDKNNYLASCNGVQKDNSVVESPRDGYEDDDDMDFMFADYFSGNMDVFTQKETANRSSADIEVHTQKQELVDSVCREAIEVSTQREMVDRSGDKVFAEIQTSVSLASKPQFLGQQDVKKVLSPITIKPCVNTSDDSLKKVQAITTTVSQSYRNGLVPFNIMKACNLLKPGFSLKRSTAASTVSKAAAKITQAAGTTTKALAAAFVPAVQQATGHDDMSPIRPPGRRRQPMVFSQSTPKVKALQAIKRSRESSATETILNFLTSSSDENNEEAQVFVEGDKTTIGRRLIAKKRRKKPKKKLIFIDDEADVSNSGDPAMMAVDSSGTSSSHNDDEFDSSFIDDDQDKSGLSTSMTKQYLQSVKSPPVARGVFKIPKLSRQHYNIDVYSQMVDNKMENSYEEDSFCVRDESDLLEKRASKRKRIMTLRSSDSDSPDEWNSNMLQKRPKIKSTLDSDYS